MERKYKHKGYQEEQSTPAPTRQKSVGFGPSSKIETRFVEVVRCSNCSNIIDTLGAISFTDQCNKCKADLHSCKNCAFFDPAARFECKKPIQARIPKKAERNMCMQFQMKVSVEKLQSSLEYHRRPKEAPSAARQAFEALFKK